MYLFVNIKWICIDLFKDSAIKCKEPKAKQT